MSSASAAVTGNHLFLVVWHRCDDFVTQHRVAVVGAVGDSEPEAFGSGLGAVMAVTDQVVVDLCHGEEICGQPLGANQVFYTAVPCWASDAEHDQILQ